MVYIRERMWMGDKGGFVGHLGFFTFVLFSYYCRTRNDDVYMSHSKGYFFGDFICSGYYQGVLTLTLFASWPHNLSSFAFRVSIFSCLSTFLTFCQPIRHYLTTFYKRIICIFTSILYWFFSFIPQSKYFIHFILCVVILLSVLKEYFIFLVDNYLKIKFHVYLYWSYKNLI